MTRFTYSILATILFVAQVSLTVNNQLPKADSESLFDVEITPRPSRTTTPQPQAAQAASTNFRTPQQQPLPAHPQDIQRDPYDHPMFFVDGHHRYEKDKKGNGIVISTGNTPAPSTQVTPQVTPQKEKNNKKTVTPHNSQATEVFFKTLVLNQ